MRKIISCVFFTTVFAVAAVSANTFKWAFSDNEYHSFGDPQSWVDENGNPVESGPLSSEDNITYNDSLKAKFDLDAQSYTVGRYYDKTWNYATYAFRNGSIEFASGATRFSAFASVHITNAIVRFSSTVEFAPDYGNNAPWSSINVYDKGVIEIDGDVLFRKATFNIFSGGRFVYGNNARALNANANVAWNVHNYGTLDWPNGFRNYNSTWSFLPYIRQYDGGDWILGDVLTTSQNIYMRIELYGGTVTATNDVSFRLQDPNGKATYANGKAYAKFMPDADLTLNVAESCTMNMARNDSRYVAFTYELDENGENRTKITRVGGGTLKLADVPYSLDLQDGETIFSANTRTAMGTLNVAAGQSFTIVNENTRIGVFEDNAGTIIITKPGLFIEALGEGANLAGDFRFEVSSFVAGDTLVETSDAALREKIFECASADFAKAGVKVLSDGDKLIAGASTFVFDSATLTDIFNPEGWQSNSLPGEGSDVFVSGEGVNAMASSDALSRWGSITVRNGATFSVSVDGKIEMPLTVLRGAVTLNINSNASFSSLSAVVDGEKYPTLTVGPGATLTVPAGFKFSNMHLVLCDGATLTERGDGPLVFGYAEAGERAYFSMHATNATITALNADRIENASRIDFASPASGGTVVVDGDIVLKNCIFTYNSRDGFAFGRNNPMAEKFKIIADNTVLNFGADTYIAGGANLVMTNGSVLCRKRHNEGDEAESWYNLRIVDAGLLTLVDRGELRTGVTRVNGDVENGAVYVTPEEAGRVGIEVLEGGIGCWYKGHGKSKGVIRFADGVMECFKGYWHGWGNRAHIFNFMAGIDVPEGKTMTLCGVSDKLYTNDTRERLTIMLESPITGGGDVIVTNTWSGKTMMPVVTTNANTCTGRIEAFECVNDETKAMVYFEDGANWAGTVVANGRMGIAEKFTDSSNYKLHGPEARHNNPVTVTFAALDLQADFPIKVWKNEGEAITNDMLNVDRYVNSGGKLVPEMATDGAEFVMGDKIRLGKIKRGAELPSFARGWILSIAPIDGDEEFDILSASFGRGFMVIVR